MQPFWKLVTFGQDNKMLNLFMLNVCSDMGKCAMLLHLTWSECAAMCECECCKITYITVSGATIDPCPVVWPLLVYDGVHMCLSVGL